VAILVQTRGLQEQQVRYPGRRTEIVQHIVRVKNHTRTGSRAFFLMTPETIGIEHRIPHPGLKDGHVFGASQID
jgi:hypothetical protein